MKKIVFLKIGIIALLSLFLSMGIGFADTNGEEEEENGAVAEAPARETEPAPTANGGEPAPTANGGEPATELAEEELRNARQIATTDPTTPAEPASYQTLKELTFDVQETLNIDPNVTERKTPKEQKYFTDTDNPPIFNFILYTIDFAIRIMGSLAVLILIIGGMILVLSGGNDTRVEKGKNTIKYAIIGIAVSMMAYVIVMIVQAILTN